MVKACKKERKDWLQGLSHTRNTPRDQELPRILPQGRAIRDNMPESVDRYEVSAYILKR